VASNVTAIAAGGDHSLFLKSDGSLWAMGGNVAGQLGDGTFNNTNRPEQIVSSNVTAIAAGGYHSLFLKSDGSLWAMGNNQYGQLGDGTYATVYPYGTNRPEQIVAGPTGYNQISGQLLSDGDVSLSFLGLAGANYALDCSFSLSPANWVPQVTNPADAGGVLVFTNTPDPTTNNFWRIRSVP
jgi:alpha-tubulin suppressor-like RCC1 family protein